MKLLQIRKILSVALVVCIISGNSVNVSAAEHTGPEEIIDQTESLSEEEESTGPSSEETAEKSEDPEDGTGDLPASGEDTSVSEEGNDAASDVKPLPSESETVTDAGIEDEQEALPTDENASWRRTQRPARAHWMRKLCRIIKNRQTRLSPMCLRKAAYWRKRKKPALCL